MLDHLDVSFAVPIGLREKHLVDFLWRQGPAEAVIAVDGAEVHRERHFWGMKSVRRYELIVGTEERHRLVIEKRKAFAYGGVRKQNFSVFVDNQKVAEY